MSGNYDDTAESLREWKQSFVKYHIEDKESKKVGVLKVEEVEFYHTQPLDSEEAVKAQIVPFCRALNYALGFDPLSDEFDEMMVDTEN